MASPKRASSAWSDLPSDLLGLVLRRLHSLADRVRVGAVCRPWRSGARLHYPNLPPPMPWVALGDRAYLDVVNSTVEELNLDLPPDADCRGSIDDLLFLTRDGGGCFLADPFSGAVHPVPDLALFLKDLTREEMFSMAFRLSVGISKVKAHWPAPGSAAAAPVVAALIWNMENGRMSCRTTIFVFRAATEIGVGRESYRTMSVDLRRVLDMAFFRGNLYALSMHGQLLKVEIDEGGSGGNPVITNVNYAIKNPRAGSYDNFDNYEEDEIVDSISREKVYPTNEAYLVESGDHLLMLKPWIVNNAGPSDNGGFDVYEADLDTIPCRWKPAHNLRGRTLFLGQRGYSSKSICVGDGYCGAQEDCIYYVRYARDSGIYNMRSGKMMKPLVPDRKVLHGSWCSWIFPDLSSSKSLFKKVLGLGSG